MEVTDATGCVAVFCDTLGLSEIGEVADAHFRIQPNPAMDAVRLMLPAAWTPTAVVVRDAAGREVLSPAVTTGAAQLDVSGLPIGSYLIEVRHTRGVAIERLIVQH